MSYFGERVVMSSLSPLVTYNPISPNNPRERSHCEGQHSVADKTRKTGCSFAIGFENNTMIVQRFPNGYMSS